MPGSPGGALDSVYFPEYVNLAPRRGKKSPGSGFPISDQAFMFAWAFLISTLIVQIIAVFVFFARVFTRAFPVWRFTIDDYIITFAFMLMTVMFGLLYEAQMWAWGGHHPAIRHRPEVQRDVMLGSIALPFWAWATGLVKISIGCMLLRFQQSRGWRTVVYIMIMLNVLLIILMGIVNLFQCIPYKATWDFNRNNKSKVCWNKDVDVAVQYVSSICNVVTDFAFSLIPLTFLGKIRRPLREKFVVGGLMALGIVASSFSLGKAIMAGRLGKTMDGTAAFTLLGLLSCLEVQTSLIAACIPTLRSSSRQFLQRIGLMHSRRGSGNRPYGAGSDTCGTKAARRAPVMELNHIESATESKLSVPASPHEVQEMEEAQYIRDPITGRITCATEAHTSRSNLNDEWRGDPERAMTQEWETQRRV